MIDFRICRCVIALTLLVGTVRAQVSDCGSPAPTEAEIRGREERLKKLSVYGQFQHALGETDTFIPVRFHVVRRSDGSGGVTLTQLNKVVATMNGVYQKGGIQFYMAGTAPHFIDDDTYYDYEYSEEAALTSGNDLPNAINIYLVGTLRIPAGSITGYAYYPSTLALSNRLFVRSDRLEDSRTVVHELGHYFNLLHTFHNNASPQAELRELVTRGPGANCSTAGDRVCDTPADPYGLDQTSRSGCTYTGSATDANNELFSPSLSNIMSYYTQCGHEFTPGQNTRLMGGLLLRTDPANEYTLDYPALGAVPQQVVASKNTGGVVITFAGAGPDASGYIIERALNSQGPYLAVAGVGPGTTSYQDATVSANTLYYYRVRASNSTWYSTSDTVQVDLHYCQPTYSSSCSPVLIADFILKQNEKTYISQLNSGCGDNSYSDFSQTIVEVAAGQKYDFVARAVANGSGSYFTQHLTIWIDFNQNGFFDHHEIVFQSVGATTMSPGLTGTIALPDQVFSGLTRMRVRSQYYSYGSVSDPCGLLAFGETEDYSLFIQTASPPTIHTTILDQTSVCPGEEVAVSYTLSGQFHPSSIFVVQIAREDDGIFIPLPTTGTDGSLLATLPDTLPANQKYKVRVMSTQAGTISTPADERLRIRPRIKATVSGQETILAGDSALITIHKLEGGSPWQFSLSNGMSFISLTDSVIQVWVAPEVTTNYVLNSVQNAECGMGAGSGSAEVTVQTSTPITLQIRVFLEGPYRAPTGLMATTLNQRGLLPGQTPINTTVDPTPPGHPYGGSPWAYTGAEAVSNYQTNIVDWVLLSLRKGGASVSNTVYRTAALLQNDGWLSIPGSPPDLMVNDTYYVVVEHRNHLGVMSHMPLRIEAGVLSYDFTIQNSYTATEPVSIGQKKIGTVFVMHSGDGNKNSANQNFLINVNDYNLWTEQNGTFDRYSPADFNMDAQLSASDKIQWSTNNSKFSMIGRE